MKELIKKFIPDFLLSWYHFALAFLGAFIYQFPSKKLTVVGVTGTNGKSTVVEMTSKILEEAGYKVASLSSIKFKIGKKEWPNTLKMTMPGRLKLQKFLRQALNAGCQYAVLEVTSEGIKQHRHKFIDFDVAVFTNLTPEHIEGVMNLRGEPISIIDLKKRLGFKLKAGSIDIILCYIKDSIVGLRVDKILNIHKYSPEDFKEVSSGFKEDIESKYVKGIVRIKEDKYLIIDVDKLI